MKCDFAAEVHTKKLAARAGQLPGPAEGHPGRLAKIIDWNFAPTPDFSKWPFLLKSSGFA